MIGGLFRSSKHETSNLHCNLQGKNEVRNMANILISDLFGFNKLRESYPDRRIKLRFNTSWNTNDRQGHRMRRDFYQMYANHEEIFEPWILSQAKSRNRDDDITFQFIEVQPHRWLFVGAYVILAKNALVARDPIADYDEIPYARAEKLPQYEAFEGRAIFDWKNKNQVWRYVSPDIVDNVPLFEILSEPILNRTNQFPGFENVNVDYQTLQSELTSVAWQTALSSVYGVYLITDNRTGRHYVGSATGAGGILSRWLTYLAKGYDPEEENSKDYPNRGLNELVQNHGLDYIRRHFSYSILEIFSKNEQGRKQALDREGYWKDVMQTRRFGYNRN